MSKKPSVPKGTRDFLPLQSLRRQYIFDTAKQVFLRYGYAPIETPAMENLDTLLGKYGEEGDKLIFKILESGDFLRSNPNHDTHIGTLVKERFYFYDILFEYLKLLIDHVSNDEEVTQISEDFIQSATTQIEDKTASWLFIRNSDYKAPLKEFLLVNQSLLIEVVKRFLSNSSYNIRTSEERQEYLGGFKDSVYLGKILPEFDRFLRNESVVPPSMGPSKLEEITNRVSSHLSSKALRYDLTVPFARFVVQNQNELSFPFKRYQIQPVWRADRPQKGRYREFYQCDVDVIGSDSLLNEAELLCIIDDVFAELGLSDIQIRLNNRKILHGIAVASGLAEHFTSMTVAIDKLDKIGLDGVKQEMLRNGLPEAGVKKALALINLKSDAQQTLKMLSGALTGVEEAYRGILEVKEVLERLPEAVREKVSIDLTLARGLNYYTGAIIEVGHPDFPSSICGGGRYDDLTGIFGLQGMSGVGVSFGADRIYDLMEDKGLFEQVVQSGSEVLFVNFGKNEVAAAWSLAADLRAEGVSCEVYPDAAKMKKQMKYANDRGVHYVVMIGEEELKIKEATVKDMRTGEQVQKTHKELVAYLSGQA